MTTWHYPYSEKNDGGWHTDSAVERGLKRAEQWLHEQGIWDWESVTIRRMECYNPEHYPDICWHYEYIFTPNDEKNKWYKSQRRKNENYHSSLH